MHAFVPALLLVASAAPGPVLTVAVDLAPLSEERFDAVAGVELEKTITVRLVQEGFGVVAVNGPAAVVLTVKSLEQPRRLVLSATGANGSASREVLLAGEPLAELHLEVTQKAVELVRQVSRPPPPVAETPDVRPGPEPLWQLGAAVGTLLREGGLDALGTLSARYGTRLRLVADAGMSGSRRGGLAVVEGTFTAGAGWAHRLGPLQLEGALSLGLLLHHFSWRTNGVRLSPLVSLPLTVSVALSPVLRLALRVVPGWSTAREHLEGDQVVWARGPLRLELLGALLVDQPP